jgi:hypothetical protein
VARGIEQAGWEVPARLLERCEEALPPGYGVKNGKVVVVII